MENLFWFFAVAVGPLLLIGAMIYATLRQRRLTRREKVIRDEKTAELYGQDRRKT